MSEMTLPKGWVWTTIEEIGSEINSGFASGKHNKSENGIPHLRPMNISPKGNIDLSDVKYVEVSEYDALREGDVLFNNTNSPVWVGKTALIKKDSEWAYSNHMTRLRFYPDSINSAWIAYHLHYLALTGFFQMYCTNHVNQASINRTFLSTRVKIPLPPLAEQHRIVAEIEKQLTRLDAGVAALRRAQARLQRYKAAVLKAACEGRLVPQDPNDEPAAVLLERILTERRKQWNGRGKYEEPQPPNTDGLPELPVGWVWARVESVGGVKLGRQRSPKHHTGQHMRPYLRVANVFEDRIDTTDILEMNFTPEEYKIYRLEYGDILLNEGQSLELVGRPAIYRGEVPGACFQNTLVRFRSSEHISRKFALYVFRAYLHSGRFQKIARWTTNIAHLGAGRFAELEFPLPPLAEQQRIVAEVERRLSVVEEVEAALGANLHRAERLRQSVLKQAFEGRLVPQDSADEPASVLLERIRKAREK